MRAWVRKASASALVGGAGLGPRSQPEVTVQIEGWVAGNWEKARPLWAGQGGALLLGDGNEGLGATGQGDSPPPLAHQTQRHSFSQQEVSDAALCCKQALQVRNSLQQRLLCLCLASGTLSRLAQFWSLTLAKPRTLRNASLAGAQIHPS